MDILRVILLKKTSNAVLPFYLIIYIPTVSLLLVLCNLARGAQRIKFPFSSFASNTIGSPLLSCNHCFEKLRTNLSLMQFAEYFPNIMFFKSFTTPTYELEFHFLYLQSTHEMVCQDHVILLMILELSTYRNSDH